MNQLPGYLFGKDNKVSVNPYEMRQLKTKRRLTGRTCFVECPNYNEIDQASAAIIAQMSKDKAVLGGCSYIVVKGPRWKYEFNVRDINGKGKWWGKRPGVFQGPLEFRQAGSFFDTTRQLYQVPTSFNVRERLAFPEKSETNKSPALAI